MGCKTAVSIGSLNLHGKTALDFVKTGFYKSKHVEQMSPDEGPLISKGQGRGREKKE